MQLYYLAFFKNQNWDPPKISAYLQARDLINRVKPEIIEDKVFSLYNVYSLDSNVLKQKIDNVIYNFVHSKENNDNTTEIKHEII